MVAWPELPLERVDTMVRTAIAAAPQVRDGCWTSRRLSDVVRKAGRRQAHREVHRHLGRPVNLVSLDAMPFELADDLHRPPATAASLGRDVVADLRLALGDHGYMVTSSAVVLLDRYCDITVDHLNAVQAKSATAEPPDGLVGLALFAAARPTKATNKSNRITDVFSDLPHPSAVALSHLLLGTDRNPEAALLGAPSVSDATARGARGGRGRLESRAAGVVSDRLGVLATPPQACAGPVSPW